jgi:hypothetical protein
MAKMGHMIENDRSRSVELGQVGENDKNGSVTENRSVIYLCMWDWTAAYVQLPPDEE